MRAEALALGLLLAMPLPARAEFPVSFTHAFGTTVIERAPERIVTIGWITQDVVLALGHVPVALPLQPWGGDADGLLPWVRDAIADLGGAPPLAFDDANIPFEALLMQRPDVILAPYSGLRDSEYARLSALAPVLPWSEAPWTGDWQQITLTVGRALGQETEARALVDAALARLEAAAAAHPQFAGLTFAFASGNPAAGTLGVHLEADPRVLLLEVLGLEPAPGVRALQSQGFYREISFEELPSIDADILILWQSDIAEIDALRSHPVFARFGPVARGCLVPITDRSFAMAASAPSPLSIPWATETLTSALSALLSPAGGCTR